MKLNYLPNDIIYEIIKYNIINKNINLFLINKNIYKNFNIFIIKKKNINIIINFLKYKKKLTIREYLKFIYKFKAKILFSSYDKLINANNLSYYGLKKVLVNYIIFNNKDIELLLYKDNNKKNRLLFILYICNKEIPNICKNIIFNKIKFKNIEDIILYINEKYNLNKIDNNIIINFINQLSRHKIFMILFNINSFV